MRQDAAPVAPNKTLARKRARGQRGQSMVEFALVFPLLLVIVMGVLEFGWALRSYITVTNAAREGARLGVTLSPDDPDTITLVKQEAVSRATGLITDTDVTVTFPDGPASANPIAVKVEHKHELITPLGKLMSFLGGSAIDDPLPVTSTSTMRIE